jgi:hypothetical protein
MSKIFFGEIEEIILIVTWKHQRLQVANLKCLNKYKVCGH